MRVRPTVLFAVLAPSIPLLWAGCGANVASLIQDGGQADGSTVQDPDPADGDSATDAEGGDTGQPDIGGDGNTDPSEDTDGDAGQPDDADGSSGGDGDTDPGNNEDLEPEPDPQPQPSPAEQARATCEGAGLSADVIDVTFTFAVEARDGGLLQADAVSFVHPNCVAFCAPAQFCDFACFTCSTAVVDAVYE